MGIPRFAAGLVLVGVVVIGAGVALGQTYPPEVRERLLNAGEEIVASTPEQFAATLKAEIAKMSKVIKEASIKID